MMMPVLQGVKGLTKKLYFVILLVGRPLTMQNFRLMFTRFTCFDIGTACIKCNDDVSFTRSKRVNEEIILHYTSSKKTSSHAKFQAHSLQGLSVLT